MRGQNRELIKKRRKKKKRKQIKKDLDGWNIT